jgi:hypothetical protein
LLLLKYWDTLQGIWGSYIADTRVVFSKSEGDIQSVKLFDFFRFPTSFLTTDSHAVEGNRLQVERNRRQRQEMGENQQHARMQKWSSLDLPQSERVVGFLLAKNEWMDVFAKVAKLRDL